MDEESKKVEGAPQTWGTITDAPSEKEGEREEKEGEKEDTRAGPLVYVKRSCKTCRFWSWSPTEDGHLLSICRRYPPPIGGAGSCRVDPIFDWCGEYESNIKYVVEEEHRQGYHQRKLINSILGHVGLGVDEGLSREEQESATQRRRATARLTGLDRMSIGELQKVLKGLSAEED